MTGMHSQLSRVIRNGASAVLLGVAVIATNSEPAHGQPSDIPGELLGSWIAEDRSSHIEFEADGTYFFIQTGDSDYAEQGNFEVQQQQIQYAPEEVRSGDQEQTPPNPYIEAWSVETRNDGTDELVTEGESDSWTFFEMDLSACSES
ncbi:hypothetical protein [Streptomyces afghaniensis]|uniref:hypothetical protein n=1 Tax=Streptomyces afghaniensis TaxID=66865 RepID=UPI000FE19331|nr:hypothetical protein [Streptomyces afghaniensis]